MIFWRHKDLPNNSERWIYFATKREALNSVGKLAMRNCAKTNQRIFFIDELKLGRVDITVFDGKQTIAKLMNRLSQGEQIDEEALLRGPARPANPAQE